MKRFWNNCVALLSVCCFCIGLVAIPVEVGADVFSNAQDFFEEYESAMVFQPGTDGKGIIYYGTKAKRSTTASVKYETVGWKVTIQDANEKVLETLYFALGGDYISAIDYQYTTNYQYTLYACSFAKLKSAMSAKSRTALEKANCKIIFDACMVVKVDGVLQGSITDGGATTGKVYTTYDGIVNARNWSEASKTNLKSYFDKTVTGLFYEVKLLCGSGIARVSGAGTYCYGATVTIDAVAKSGYTFSKWSGSKNTSTKKYSFVMSNANVSLTANAIYTTVKAQFYRNWSDADTTMQTRSYTYDNCGTTLPDLGFVREGYTQIGWSTDPTAVKPMYITEEVITEEWIAEYIPLVKLYATWYPNEYLVCYDSNGGSGDIYNPTMSYRRTLTLPADCFVKEGYTLVGWSLYEGDSYAEYACKEQVQMADLVEKLGLGLQNHATITFYAVWDDSPVIEEGDLYVTLADAMSGTITEEWLAAQVLVVDAEDGVLDYGIRDGECFYMLDYSATDFTMFRKEGYVTETFFARDSVGNTSKRMVTIHIVEPEVYDEADIMGRVRFISEKYYKDEAGAWVTESAGGLSKLSIWRLDEAYQSILEELFT